MFAVPAYGFIAVVFVMIVWGLWRSASRHVPQAESASFGIAPLHGATGAAVLLLALRAFSRGCTA